MICVSVYQRTQTFRLGDNVIVVTLAWLFDKMFKLNFVVSSPTVTKIIF